MKSFLHQKLQHTKEAAYTNAPNAARRVGREASDPAQKFPTNTKLKIPI